MATWDCDQSASRKRACVAAERGDVESGGLGHVACDHPVAAAVGQHRDPRSARRCLRPQRQQHVGELARGAYLDRAGDRAGRSDHGGVAGQRARVGLGAAGSGGARTGGQHHDRRACRDRGGGRLDEPATVAEILDVDGDRRGRGVGRARVDQLDEGHVGLVAERDEARDAQAPCREQPIQLDGEIATLAEHGHASRRELVRREIRRGRVVNQPKTIGADQHRTRLADPRDQGVLAGPPSAPASPRPAVIATIARAPLASTPWTASSKPASGTAMTARSTGRRARRPSRRSGCRGSRRRVGSPVARGAGRLPRSACSATALPHLAGSALAPTTAIEAGSNSAAQIPAHFCTRRPCRACADGVVRMVGSAAGTAPSPISSAYPSRRGRRDRGRPPGTGRSPGRRSCQDELHDISSWSWVLIRASSAGIASARRRRRSAVR